MRIIDPHHRTAHRKYWYVIACAVSIALFGLLLVLVMFVPVISHWDAEASRWMQSLRSATFDPIMLAVTLTGDVFVAACVAMAILLYLLLHRRWWLSIHLLSVCLSAIWVVMIMKLYTARARPGELSTGLDSFSFPSGHACTAAIMAGIAALFIAQERPQRVRYGIYALATLVTLVIGVSRVYLHVHWPTDVVAGWCAGYALVMAFAWQLHSGDAVTKNRLTPWILGVSGFAVVAHLLMSWTVRVSTYGVMTGS